MVKMAKATQHIWHPLAHSVIKRALLLSNIPPHKNGTQHKWHLTKMVSHNYIIVFLKYYQHPANRTYPYNNTQQSKNTCHFCKVPLFSKQMGLKGAIFVGCL